MTSAGRSFRDERGEGPARQRTLLECARVVAEDVDLAPPARRFKAARSRAAARNPVAKGCAAWLHKCYIALATVLGVSGSTAPALHRHGRRVHEHPYAGEHRHLWLIERSQPFELSADPHEHEHHDHGEHGHLHGLVDRSIVRSRAGLKAVSLGLGVLGAAALVQAGILLLTGSVALLADLIHNVGDALTAVPVGIAFLLRSFRAEKIAGLTVVLAILVSACVALYESIERLINPQELSHLWVLAAAGLVGFAGNELAAQVRLWAGKRLSSPALIADGNHARVDGFVSLGVVASAIVVALGAPVGDPIIGLLITAVILKITWDSWRTVSTTEPGELIELPEH
jgi:Co/Zn/Cd efflux system component